MPRSSKKIIILGAGRVGRSVAESLVREGNDVTVVDVHAGPLQDLQNRLDIRTVLGNGAFPSTLRQADAQHADIILAVTDSDEINITACQVTSLLFHTPTKIARIRAAEYLATPELFSEKGIPIDVIISPDQVVASYIKRLIEYPTAFQVLDFAQGKLELVAVKAYHGGPLVGHQLRDLAEHLPGIEARVAAIYRHDRAILPEGDTVIHAGDEVFFVATPSNIQAVLSELRKLERPMERIMLAGGGYIGHRLALSLEQADYDVKLIELSPDRARVLSEDLRTSIVLLGDATDEELLQKEGIEAIDAFCALTNDDEDNILSALMAKRLGARKVMALINRTAYVDLVHGASTIDIAISPQQATIGTLLTHVRGGRVASVHSLRRGAAEAIEGIATGSPRSSSLVGRTISRIKLPPGTTIGAIVRGDEVIMAHHDSIVQDGDHIILFLVDKRYLGDVERLFKAAP